MGIMKNGIVYGETFDAREIPTPLIADDPEPTLQKYFFGKRPGWYKYFVKSPQALASGETNFSDSLILLPYSGQIFFQKLEYLKNSSHNLFTLLAYPKIGQQITNTAPIVGIPDENNHRMRWKFPKETYRFTTKDFVRIDGESQDVKTSGIYKAISITDKMIPKGIPYLSQTRLDTLSNIAEKLAKLKQIFKHFRYEWTIEISQGGTPAGTLQFSGWPSVVNEDDSELIGSYCFAMPMSENSNPTSPNVAVPIAFNVGYLSSGFFLHPFLVPENTLKIADWFYPAVLNSSVEVSKITFSMTLEESNDFSAVPYPEIYNNSY